MIEAEGRKALVLPGDVSDSAFCQEAVKKVLKESRASRLRPALAPTPRASTVF